jgi:hypothetical protein
MVSEPPVLLFDRQRCGLALVAVLLIQGHAHDENEPQDAIGPQRQEIDDIRPDQGASV